jgi:hypothetical protein
MRGGYLHNRALAQRLTTTLEDLGARFWIEYPAGPGRRAGAVDIYIELGEARIACEIELGPGRIDQDLRKASALSVDLLLIVAPTPDVARAIRRRLMTIRPRPPQVQVRLIASAIKYLSDLSVSECRQDKKTETPRV